MPAKRCTYREGRRRCTFDGVGEPSLCSAHRVAVAEASRPRPPGEVLAGTFVDLLSGRPINREQTLGAIQDFAAQWSGAIGGGYRPDVTPGETEGSVHRRGQPGSQRPWWWNIPHAGSRPSGTAPPPPPTPEDVELQKRRAARQVFGFKETARLTESLIKERHRELVRRHHPDRGGSTARMAVINDARDILMASL